MNALILNQPGDLQIAPSKAPEKIQAGDALVRVHRVGVCGTDYHAFRGRQPFFSYPRILGHELGVEVLQLASDVKNVCVGDRCTVEPYLNCGACIACRRGKPNCCTDLKVLGVHTDGGLRQQIVLPARKLHASKTLSFDQLALVETLGIGAHAVARAQIESGEWALVIGAGPIGLGAMQFAQAAGARVLALDANIDRLEFCRQQLGVENCVVAGEDAWQTVRDVTDGDGPTAVFDATGNAASMNAAFNFCAAGGRLVFVGLHTGEVAFNDAEFHRRELTLFASRNATGEDFQNIIAQMESGAINTRPWITHRADFADVPAQFESWLDPQSRVIKAMISL